MKILSVNNTADIYGASRCMERVFGRFAQDGHEVHAVLPERGPLADLLEARGVHVHIHRRLAIIDRAQFRSVFGILKFLFFFPISVLWLAALDPAPAHRPDSHQHNRHALARVGGIHYRRTHVWHVRELLGEFGWLFKPYQHYIHLLSSAMVAISYCTRDQFSPRLRDKVHVIYDGLDADRSYGRSRQHSGISRVLLF